MRLNFVIILAVAVRTASSAPIAQQSSALPALPAAINIDPNGSLTQMLSGAASFAPNFLSGNPTAVAGSLGDMVAGAATFAPNYLAGLAGLPPVPAPKSKSNDVEFPAGAVVEMTSR